MKIEKVSDSTVKITMNIEDMQKWNINIKAFQPNDPKANEVFWHIIHEASEKTGMSFENCKLTIEVMQRDAESFVIYITKKEFEPGEITPSIMGMPKTESSAGKKYKYKKRQGKPVQNTSVLVYTFDDFNDICKFAKNNLYYCLLFENNNCLYKHGGAYRLVVNIPPNLKDFVPQFNSCICEYANQEENSYVYSSYLFEHGETIISDNSLKIIYNNF